MAWTLFYLSVAFALLARNVSRPVRRPGFVALVCFFAGWLVGELPLHHIALEVLIALGFVAGGALRGWPGWAGLALTGYSVGTLYSAFVRARGTRVVLDSAMREGLGDAYDDRIAHEDLAALDGNPDWAAIARPFPISHPDVERIARVVYHEEDGVCLRANVFRHRSHPTGTPTLVFVHGGGWVIGHKSRQGLPLLNHLASLGWTCFSVDYRLSPRATFPDHLIDVKRAIAWVRQHGAEFGADPNLLVVCGNSAGAHLASLAALTPNAPEWQPGFEHADTSVSGCVALYGVYDLMDRHGSWPHRGMERLIERLVIKASRAEAEGLWRKFSPIEHVRPAAPPFLVIHGDCDSLVPVGQARHFVAALQTASHAPVCYAEVAGAQHAFDIFPSLRSELTVRAIARWCAWLKEYRAADAPSAEVERPPEAPPAVRPWVN